MNDNERKEPTAPLQSSGTPNVIRVDADDETDPAIQPISASAVSAIPTGEYNHQKEQEKARRNIAYWLVWIVAGIITLGFGYFWTLPLTRGSKEYVDNLVLVLQIVFTPIITLAGTAIGYYFGANASQR